MLLNLVLVKSHLGSYRILQSTAKKRDASASQACLYCRHPDRFSGRYPVYSHGRGSASQNAGMYPSVSDHHRLSAGGIH